MLIPIGHENMTARRWPIITIALILINIFAFLATKTKLYQEWADLGQLTANALYLAATHPELEVPQELKPLIREFRKKNQEEWDEIGEQAQSSQYGLSDESGYAGYNSALQKKLSALGKKYVNFTRSSMTHRYAYIPVQPNPVSYLTANFLHGGWLHLIGNIWFLWLAGFVLEDVWGRPAYIVFYIIAGFAALLFYAWTNPGSVVPTLGASGAVAALMGAFLIRFPKMKIEMAGLFLFRPFRFRASAYWLLPLWLLTEIFYGSIFGAQTGVAHWAHVGGFLFGAVAVIGIRFSGIEKSSDAAIEAKVYGDIDPEIRQAQVLIDNGKLDEAVAVLLSHTEINPASVDAWNVLRDVYEQKRDLPACMNAALKCCELHLKAHEGDAAWRDYEDFKNAGGDKLPPAIRFDFCRLLESQGKFETAITEYERLSVDYPEEQLAFKAQLAAGKICRTKLNRPQDALKFYEAAQASSVPHLDYEQTIRIGIQEASAALLVIGADAGNTNTAEQASTISG